jgi:hypothetical protein
LMTILSIRGGNYLGNSHTQLRIRRLLIKNRKITVCFSINIVYGTQKQHIRAYISQYS